MMMIYLFIHLFFLYLGCDDDDLEQLQDELVRFTTLGVEFVAGAHEEVLQLPANGLLALVGAHPLGRHGAGELVVAVVVATVAVRRLVIPTVIRGAVAAHRAGGVVLVFSERYNHNRKTDSDDNWFVITAHMQTHLVKNLDKNCQKYEKGFTPLVYPLITLVEEHPSDNHDPMDEKKECHWKESEHHMNSIR